jgi:hypothetical protein
VKAKELDSISQARDYWRMQSNHYCNLNEIKLDYIAALESQNETVLNELKDCSGLLAEAHTFMQGGAFMKLVANKDKHPAANDNYLYIEGKINGKREAGLFTLNDWSKAKERLLKNPEDKPNH